MTDISTPAPRRLSTAVTTAAKSTAEAVWLVAWIFAVALIGGFGLTIGHVYAVAALRWLVGAE